MQCRRLIVLQADKNESHFYQINVVKRRWFSHNVRQCAAYCMSHHRRQAVVVLQPTKKKKKKAECKSSSNDPDVAASESTRTVIMF